MVRDLVVCEQFLRWPRSRAPSPTAVNLRFVCFVSRSIYLLLFGGNVMFTLIVNITYFWNVNMLSSNRNCLPHLFDFERLLYFNHLVKHILKNSQKEKCKYAPQNFFETYTSKKHLSNNSE